MTKKRCFMAAAAPPAEYTGAPAAILHTLILHDPTIT